MSDIENSENQGIEEQESNQYIHSDSKNKTSSSSLKLRPPPLLPSPAQIFWWIFSSLLATYIIAVHFPDLHESILFNP